MRLAGEVAIVTGSTSGIGAEIARRFGAEGAKVVVTGRDQHRGAAVANECGGVFVAADLAETGAPRTLVDSALASFGALTIVVNNAVTSDAGDGPVTALTVDMWEHVLRVNVIAAALLCAAAIPEMVKAGHGSIVNVSSLGAARGIPGLAAYGASKAALEALTRAIAVDYAGDAVRANVIAPGYVVSERRPLDDDQRALIQARHLTRLGQPADVAHAAVYLASRESEFVTGAVLRVDGGATAARPRTLR